MQKEESFLVAQFGRTVGLKGDLKLNLLTDFPEQFINGRVITTNRGQLTIEHYNPKRNIIKIVGYNSLEDAKRLTNAKIFSSKEETKQYCNLKEGQFFWHDLIGATIVENKETLGVIKEIQRLPQSDYLLINTNKKLIDAGLAKSFLIPYIPNFIKKVDINSKIVETSNAKDILEAS